ncbi:MAG: bifunctional [glutamate--ammonia ligase]-adenylyl-L-tyrosine phosphorylase/[glutamate--ammonia-ligase] adenylyltransferase [Deltaproteobacteria bacterium]|nr:bifunctional [glutamate--ammonia ligase]-adenylyl-L-tyrosine phosphorylase/[glutamate--ammonia-ligase] adenylyltransferase [Deltaproteobacteria bacterium]
MRRKVERLIKDSPSPALARANLTRLIESGSAKSVNKIPASDLPSLFRLLGGSAYLSDVLIRQGRDWPDLFLRQIATEQKTTSDHLAELAPALRRCASGDELARLLRRHKQREYLRIGARDLSPSVSVEETTRELSALAEASLEIAYRFCRSEVEKDFGALSLPGGDKPNRFVILGMGKLGGEELNFSSDIDIIYLYEEDEGESAGGGKGKTTPRQFFHTLAERITRVVGDITEDGFVFRIDLRLRPLGRNGPLVQSLGSALLYYESWGQCWERSALIKARAVAGAAELGTRFLRDVEPFVYRRYLDFTTIEELRHMKMRIQRELLGPQNEKSNVKLGYGGIREIEFFAQALQLLNGGAEPGVRQQNTLRALELLAGHGFISLREKAKLSDAYRFLRDVEHKIQMVQEGHVHSIPGDDAGRRALARRLGYEARGRRSEWQLFRRDLLSRTASVRRAFDRLFYGAQKELRSRSGPGLSEIWNDLDQEELLLPELARLGFADPQRAYRNLLEMRDGAAYSPPSPRRIAVMRILGPALIAEIAKSGAPDRALANFAEFSHRVGARTGFLSLLAENPKTTRLLVSLFANSQFLTDLFLKRPELLDSLIRVDLTQLRKTRGEMGRRLLAAFADTAELEGRLNAIRRYKAEEFIRIALHDLGGSLELGDVIVQLSELAEACVEAALALSLEEIEKSFGTLPGGKFTVLGMGKLGGKEIDYNSDLDLIFVYDAPDEARSQGGQGLDPHDYYVRLGQKLMTFLSAPTEEGIAYRIDLRLRPSGKFGPVVSSLAAFRHYHQTSSELWERQALIKARFVAGERSLGTGVERVAEDFAYGRGLTPDGVGEIHHLRMRMERELAREDASRFNLKKGKGGMVDIEFLTQMLQLSHGWRLPALRERGTLEALKALKKEKIIKASEHRLLSEGYLFLRRLDHRLRLQRDQSIDTVEREPGELYGVAQALGYKGNKKKNPGALLLRDYEARRERIRACYQRFFKMSATEGE